MKRKIIFTFFLAFWNGFLFAQIKLAGIILDNKTQHPIEYANVGFLDKGVGTVSNSSGKFDLHIPKELQNSVIQISHVGYETKTIKCSELLSNSPEIKIELKPNSIGLPELTIIASHEESLGFKPIDDKVKGFFKAKGLGLEAGTLIKNTGQIALTEFHFNILKIPYDSLKFRLNIYSVKRGKPSDKINVKDIIFSVSKADTGGYSLLLTNDKLIVNNNFICSIELIELFGQPIENAEFWFSAIPNKFGLIYKKRISQGGWEYVKKYSLCFWLTGKKIVSEKSSSSKLKQ